MHPNPFANSSLDHFDRLPDSLLLLVFNKIGDVKTVGRCCVVSRRFHSLIPHVENVLVRVDCVISDDEPPEVDSDGKFCSPLGSLFRLVFGNILKHLQVLGQFLGPHRASGSVGSGDGTGPMMTVGDLGAGEGDEGEKGGMTHHSPSEVLKNFNEIRVLRIELPSGELGVDDGVLLKWRADFGSTLDNCVILGASSVVYSAKNDECFGVGLDLIAGNGTGEDDGSMPELLYTNGGLKLRVVWTISSLIAASARHYLLQPIIAEHKTLDSLVLADADGQGLLCMNRDQLEELRVKPLSASLASKRTLVPALNMMLWYAPHLELPDGIVLKGATLVAIQPSEQSGVAAAKKEVLDLSWVSSAFEEPYGTAARMLVNRRTYCLEMNSF